jgi:hypothetical protein
MRIAGITLLAMVMGACRVSPAGQAPSTLVVVPQFGPVIGAEVIAGRARQDGIVLLAGGTDLVHVDLRRRTSDRHPLALAPGESCWSLASLDSGALWTLKGRHAAVRIEADGGLASEMPLADAHFGLFAAGDRLVFQEAVFTAPGPALHVVAPDGQTRQPWSDISTRAFDTLARASSAALNMLSCGLSDEAEQPCWFPDEAALFLLGTDGRTRRVSLEGLQVVSPQTLLTSDNPALAIRDAYVERGGSMWILSSGSAPAGTETLGGWIVAHYGARGEPKGLSRLSEPARLILGVDNRYVTLLLSSGHVGVIDRW